MLHARNFHNLNGYGREYVSVHACVTCVHQSRYRRTKGDALTHTRAYPSDIEMC